MAKNITYLLGAGASANTIPVVIYIHNRIAEIIRFLKHRQLPVDRVDIARKTIGELEWLLQAAGNYYTIDTLAKKYYLTGDHENLKRLKKSLIIYFALEQYVNIPSEQNRELEYYFKKNSIDKRYGSFIAAITRKSYPVAIAGAEGDGLAAESRAFALSKHIKILSWNYDLQFEMSLQQLTGTVLQHVKTAYQILPNKISLNENNDIITKHDKFAMVKLNGDAIWDIQEQPSFNKSCILDGKEYIDEVELLFDFLDRFKKSESIFEGNSSPLLSFNFAWENDNNFKSKYAGYKKNLETAELIAEQTEILVVIGYSFPIFNREIDKKLFAKMERLEKVYIQDKSPERIMSTMQSAFEQLQKNTLTGRKDDMKSAPLVKFVLDDNLNQFTIPFELDE